MAPPARRAGRLVGDEDEPARHAPGTRLSPDRPHAVGCDFRRRRWRASEGGSRTNDCRAILPACSQPTSPRQRSALLIRRTTLTDVSVPMIAGARAALSGHPQQPGLPARARGQRLRRAVHSHLKEQLLWIEPFATVEACDWRSWRSRIVTTASGSSSATAIAAQPLLAPATRPHSRHEYRLRLSRKSRAQQTECDPVSSASARTRSSTAVMSLSPPGRSVELRMRHESPGQ